MLKSIRREVKKKEIARKRYIECGKEIKSTKEVRHTVRGQNNVLT